MAPERDPSLGELDRMEARLLERVLAARDRYQQAKTEASLLTALGNGLGLDHPDGRATALKAARIEREAIENYALALREFTNFILKNMSSQSSREE